MSGPDFSEEEIRIIGLMAKAEKALPDDFWHVAALQELACVLARYSAIMTEEHCAAVIGCGAMLMRHGKREMMAEIQARMALAKASAHPTQGDQSHDRG